MPTSSIDTRLVNFGELLAGSNYYSVPHFQRDYSWTETEVEELWVDINSTIDENRDEHFIGAIVVNNSTKPNLTLIDGQQRITTISLLMCVIRDIAKEEGDSQLATAISERYLGSLDLDTREIKSKLKLNETSDQFYQENFINSKGVEELKKASKKLNRISSRRRPQKLMLDAYMFLYKKIKELVEETTGGIKILIKLEKCIRDKLISIVISVADEANSYLIFETLNNRGLELSVSDLLKNHLFSKAGDKLFDVQKYWVEINREIDNLELTKFIRHYWISNCKVVSEKELFRSISSQLKTPTDVFEFVKSLRESSEVYSSFDNEQNSTWDSFDAKVKADIVKLRLFDVNQCYSALLAAKECLADKNFTSVLRMIVIFSFRYSVICSLNPSKLELAYSNMANFIRSNRPNSIKPIYQKIANLYPDDEVFFESFQKKMLSKSHAGLARYILSEINSYYTDQKELVANPNSAEINLEHILPQKPNDSWLSKFSKSKSGDWSQYVYRLGNMTLLDSTINRKAGNSSFQEKCSTAFSHSNLVITKELLTCQSWGPRQIEERQNRMAKAACQIWRLSY